MSEDAQKYYDAAKRVPSNTYVNKFGATGVDLVEPSRAADPNLRAVLGGGFDVTRNTVHGLMTSGDNRSIQANNMQATDNGMGGSAGKEDEEKKRQQELDRLLLQLTQRLAEIDREIGDLRGKIAENESAIKLLKTEADQIKEIDAKLADHLSGKKPLKVINGKIEDEQVEVALRAYETKTGKKVDRNDPKALNDALHDMRSDFVIRLNQIEEERLRRENENDQYRKKIGDLETERTKVDNTLQDVKAAKQSGDPVAYEKAKEEAEKVIVQEKKIEIVEAASAEADDLGDLNAMAVADAAPLKPSAAAAIDPQADTLRMRGNFNEQAQLQKVELAQVNAATAKPVV